MKLWIERDNDKDLHVGVNQVHLMAYGVSFQGDNFLEKSKAFGNIL